jgi:hypothetical protein
MIGIVIAVGAIEVATLGLVAFLFVRQRELRRYVAKQDVDFIRLGTLTTKAFEAYQERVENVETVCANIIELVEETDEEPMVN